MWKMIMPANNISAIIGAGILYKKEFAIQYLDLNLISWLQKY